MVTRRLLPRHALPVRALLLCAALCVLCAAAHAEGATMLDEYRNRVNGAKERIEELAWLHETAMTGDDDESEDVPSIGERITSAEAQLPGELRRLLPPTEKVEWAHAGLTVDNAWVHQAITDYERETSAGHEERIFALWHIVERLGALSQRLAELENANASRARDKEAEKGQLAAILRRLETGKAKKNQDESALNRLIRKINEGLQSLSPEPPRIVTGASPQLSIGAQIFIYVLGVGVIAFVLWTFRAQIFRRRRKRKTATSSEARIVLGERLAPDETAADLLAEAERLARGGDPRGAIRKAYVALLCELADRKIIRLARHKTNRDYLGAMRERPELYSEMKPLTINYEKHWYGFETATDGDWSDFRARCRSAMSPKSKVQSPKSETVSEV